MAAVLDLIYQNGLGIMKTLRLLTPALLLSASSIANATIIDGYGTYASTGTSGDCPSYCTSPFAFGEADGGELSTSAYSEENTYGSARAEAILGGVDSTSVLRVQAGSAAGQGASATAYAVQGYNYTGTGTTTYELDLNLHGSVTNSDNGYSNNNLSLSFAILKGDDLEWYPDFATQVYEFGFGLEEVATEYLYIGNGLDINEGATVSFDVAEGESFYVLTSMGAISRNGEADGWNTFTMSFDDATGLEAVASAAPVDPVEVPEASSFALFASALFALVALRRKQA